MIDEVARSPASRPPVPPDRWRRWWLALLVLTAVVASGFLAGRGLSSSAATVPTVPSATPSASASPAPAPSAPTPEATTKPAVVADQLSLAGKVPTHGSGSFVYA